MNGWRQRVEIRFLAACVLFLLAACAGDRIPDTGTPPPLPAPVEATIAAATAPPPTAPPPTAPPPTAPPPPSPRVEATLPLPSATPTAPQARATPSPTPKSPSPTPAGPSILAFAAAPTTTQRLGETIALSWQAQGDQASLCPFVLGLGGPAPLASACVEAPLAGSRTITVTEEALDWDGMSLRVTQGAAAAQAVVTLTLGCQGLVDWFFAHPPPRCPQAAAITSPAAGQRFEAGLMIWLQQPDRFYVFFDETPPVFQWVEAPYRFHPGASAANRVGEAPPAGLFEPVSGFGQLWRGEIEGVESLRSRLGWASGPEFGFTSHYQCARPLGRLWTCFLAGPDGQVLVLRPDSSAQARFLWAVW